MNFISQTVIWYERVTIVNLRKARFVSISPCGFIPRTACGLGSRWLNLARHCPRCRRRARQTCFGLPNSRQIVASVTFIRSLDGASVRPPWLGITPGAYREVCWLAQEVGAGNARGGARFGDAVPLEMALPASAVKEEASAASGRGPRGSSRDWG